MNEFEKNARDQLRAAERELNPQTLAALAAMRKDVLTQVKPRGLLPRFALPAFGMAMASVVAMVLVFSPGSEKQGNYSPDNPKLSDNIELYEDMDFYNWLAQSGYDVKG
jgi:hypothetical protein